MVAIGMTEDQEMDTMEVREGLVVEVLEVVG
jgi:hypothetical protein